MRCIGIDGKGFFLPTARRLGLAMTEKTIMGEVDIRRALARIAHEIVERNRGIEDAVLVGLLTRGVPLAHRLAKLLERMEGRHISQGQIDITFHRDDLASRPLQPLVGRSDIPVDVSDLCVILVDDVLYTGRSIRAAMEEIMDYGRPHSIQLAVLVDRGHRELPIRPDYVGKNVPTSRDEEVRVKLGEVDGVDRVLIVPIGETA